MANFDRSGMTQAGINLMGKAVGGATIQFTRLVLGDGTMTGEILDLKGVVSPKQNVDVTRIERNNSQCTVGGELLTSSVKQGFFWRECGLYAMDPDEGEILYNYAYATKPDYIAASDSGMMEEILVSMVATVGSNANVNVTIDDSMVFATKKETNDKIMVLNEKLEDIAVSIRDFPKITPEANDTGRIQRAIDSYSRIFLPDATYQVSQLVMKTNTHLIGQSIKGVIIKGIDATVKSVIYSDLSANNYSIENMIIDAPQNVTGILLDNIGTLSTQDLHPEIRNVIILNGYNGLQVKSGVRGGLFDNVRPGAVSNIGIAVESTDSIFTNCVVAMAKYDGFKVVNSNNTFINCKAFCCGDSISYGAGFKLQGSFNRLINCEFQQNRFENLYLQNANNNIVQGCILDSAGWGAAAIFPTLYYADGGAGSQVPISGLRTYNSNNNIIDVSIINGRLNGASKCALYGQYSATTSNNDIRFTTFDNLTDGIFVDCITDYQNAYYNQNKVVINGIEKINKAFTLPRIVSGNCTVNAGGHIEKNGVVYFDAKITVNNTLSYVAELLSDLPKPIIDSAMQIYFSSFKYCAINTSGSLVVGGTVTEGDVYRICGSYIKA